ncbi:hypothetical protein WMY93_012250 [Mugilogobius chulae]|uniref:Uncharacterized protein n=1 Tax=Mugilogobius chulae TaxID=88201 RepID=A0AAW0P8J9_9GOBI
MTPVPQMKHLFMFYSNDFFLLNTVTPGDAPPLLLLRECYELNEFGTQETLEVQSLVCEAGAWGQKTAHITGLRDIKALTSQSHHCHYVSILTKAERPGEEEVQSVK